MVRFEWDERKAASNLRKHGISFVQAIQVFRDPYVFSEQDRSVDGESRWQSIGTVAGVAILLVAHTFTEENGIETIRVISAREATRKERLRYEQNRADYFG